MLSALQLASVKFEQQFNHRPLWAASAPGRVNIIGEHTDYNNGFVLPMVIDRRTYALARPNSSNFIHIHSSNLKQTEVIGLEYDLERSTNAPWSNYIRGVLAGVRRIAPIPGMDMLIDSSVPTGGGLSSSAALEVAVATLLEQALSIEIKKGDKALLCQRAEHEFVGVPCGLMDQSASIFGKSGHALLIDCDSMSIDYIPIESAEVSILIVNTRVSHSLAAGEYARRRAECQTAATRMKVRSLREATPAMINTITSERSDAVSRRARHVFSENQRTLKTARALQEKNWSEAGRLMYESHESLRTDFEVSCRELDIIVNAAREMGASKGLFGCRMTGGGFGGCAVALVRKDLSESAGQAIAAAYKFATGIEPAVFVSGPSAGAQPHALGGGT